VDTLKSDAEKAKQRSNAQLKKLKDLKFELIQSEKKHYDLEADIEEDWETANKSLTTAIFAHRTAHNLTDKLGKSAIVLENALTVLSESTFSYGN
jgi:hypothetical protein